MPSPDTRTSRTTSTPSTGSRPTTCGPSVTPQRRLRGGRAAGPCTSEQVGLEHRPHPHRQRRHPGGRGRPANDDVWAVGSMFSVAQLCILRPALGRPRWARVDVPNPTRRAAGCSGWPRSRRPRCTPSARPRRPPRGAALERRRLDPGEHPGHGLVWDSAAAGPGTVWAVGQRGNPNTGSGPDLHPARATAGRRVQSRLRSRPAGGYARGRMPRSWGLAFVTICSRQRARPWPAGGPLLIDALVALGVGLVQVGGAAVWPTSASRRGGGHWAAGPMPCWRRAGGPAVPAPLAGGGAGRRQPGLRAGLPPAPTRRARPAWPSTRGAVDRGPDPPRRTAWLAATARRWPWPGSSCSSTATPCSTASRCTRP